MLRQTVFYPNREGAKFDFNYYLQKHIPLANEILGGKFTIARGLPSPDNKPPAFVCIASIDIDNPEDFARRAQARGSELNADVAHYTNIAPIIQTEEILA
jgi:uncharacterized protein (TIGR02118 family)